MTEFVTMWKNYVNFSDRTTVRGYWMAYLIHFIIVVVLSAIFMGALNVPIIVSLYGLAAFLPTLGMMIRRFRDAGVAWTNVFWLFLPLIGLIIVIIKLCKPSLPDDGVPVV